MDKNIEEEKNKIIESILKQDNEMFKALLGITENELLSISSSNNNFEERLTKIVQEKEGSSSSSNKKRKLCDWKQISGPVIPELKQCHGVLTTLRKNVKEVQKCGKHDDSKRGRKRSNSFEE